MVVVAGTGLQTDSRLVSREESICLKRGVSGRDDNEG